MGGGGGDPPSLYFGFKKIKGEKKTRGERKKIPPLKKKRK